MVTERRTRHGVDSLLSNPALQAPRKLSDRSPPTSGFGPTRREGAPSSPEMDSCGWGVRMANEEGTEGMANSADAAASWQQCYTWCTSYSQPHQHHHHPHHPRQYQGDQYQQLPGSASAVNASTPYSSPQQHHLQLQSSGQPSPLNQQQHLHPVRGQAALRRAVPYDGPGILILSRARARASI